jgi:hypothetical protein
MSMSESTSSSNRLWVEQEFAGVSLGDKRLDRRLIDSVTAIADQPNASNPHRFDWNELRGYYLLTNSKRADLETLQTPHRLQTRKRMLATMNRLLIIHDGTELDFTSHPAAHHFLGPVGDGDGVGLLQHNSLVFDPVRKQILGLVHQQLHVRQPAPPGETRTERAFRDEKESQFWMEGFLGVGQAPEGARWIDVCDRGADFFDAMEESIELDHEFLIRVYQDRCIAIEEDGETVETGYLHEAMSAVKSQASKTVSVASKGGRPAREVVVNVGYQAVLLQPPKNRPDVQENRDPIAATLIRVWEAGSKEARQKAQEARQKVKQIAQEVKATKRAAELADKGAAKKTANAECSRLEKELEEAKQELKEKNRQASEHLDWWLATNSPVESVEDALQAVSDYEWRWPVAEEYHKAEKSGLGIENQRFESLHGLTAALAIIAVVAVRLLQLRYARDEMPDAPARVVATPEEIEMVAKATKYKGKNLTVKQFVDRLARLGGYLGRKCDGPPGWMTLWRGYQRLADLLLGQEIALGIHSVEYEDDGEQSSW